MRRRVHAPIGRGEGIRGATVRLCPRPAPRKPTGKARGCGRRVRSAIDGLGPGVADAREAVGRAVGALVLGVAHGGAVLLLAGVLGAVAQRRRVGRGDAGRGARGAGVRRAGVALATAGFHDHEGDESRDQQKHEDERDHIAHALGPTHAAGGETSRGRRADGPGLRPRPTRIAPDDNAFEREGRPAMADDKLQGKRIAFLVAPEGTEQVELTEPWKAVEEAGGAPELLSTEPGEVQAFNHLDKADTCTVDKTVEEADASDYDALVLPGGVSNPDFLRIDEGAVAFVRE